MEVQEKPKTTVVNRVQKNIRMDLWNIIEFQILSHCHLNKIFISEFNLKCLTFLVLNNNMELTTFCTEVIKKGLSGSTQSVRNILAKAEKKGLVTKLGKSKKKILINPDLNIQATGNILLDYKIMRVDPKELQ